MPKGVIKNKRQEAAEFPDIDLKIRKTLILMTDKYNEAARKIIRDSYNNSKLLKKYERIRASGLFQRGGGGPARHRKVAEFPNGQVFDFVDTVLSKKYGPNWLQDNRAMKHELVRPWLVVEKI